MSHSLRILLLSASVCWIASGGQADAGVNLIVNGGFEAGNLSSWTTSALTANQTAAAVPGFANTGNYAALFRAQSESGTISFSQTIATKVGEQYDIIFYATGFIQQNTVPNLQSIQVQFGNTVVTPANLVVPLSNTTYTQFDYEATATSALTTLQFSFNFTSGNGNEGIYLDDVYVAVPEPASVTMTGMGCLMGLGVALRRRRLKATVRPEAV